MLKAAGRSSTVSSGFSNNSGWGGGFFSNEGQITADMVDTTTSENALRLALEAREMGIDTIEELEYQAGMC